MKKTSKPSKKLAQRKKNSGGKRQKRVCNSTQAKLLDWALEEYAKEKYLQTDPLWYPHQYSKPTDQELASFFAICVAYGNVAAIRSILERILGLFGSNLYDNFLNFDFGKSQDIDFYYRFFKASDFLVFFSLLQKQLRKYKSFECIFAQSKSPEPLQRLFEFREKILPEKQRQTYGLSYMLPDPTKGAAKRLHLFMRWMVRDSHFDLGLWKSVTPSELFIPLDTHIFKAAQYFGWLSTQQTGLKSVLEITSALKYFDAQDPIKYDFALCRLGMLNQNLPEIIKNI